MSYQIEHSDSINKAPEYWGRQSKLIDWYMPPTEILSTNTAGDFQWFADGTLNTSYLALDYHVNHGRGEQTAIIYDSPVTNSQQKLTYRELTHLVACFADVLASKGVEKGDRVLIYMPMIPEAVIAMLACARLGAVHSVVFGGFASHELAVRIDDAKPKVIVSASCGIEINRIIHYKPLLDEAIEEASFKPQACIIVQRPQHRVELHLPRDFDYHQLMSKALPREAVPVSATDPLYILYTSGTTGKPKGVIRDNGGHAVAMAYSMKTVYGMKPGDVFWAASDVGWVVGHSYIVYAPLISGCTSILYEGKPIKTPNAGAFWRVCEQYKVNVLFSAPTAFRAICKEDPQGQFIDSYDLSSLQRLYLAGERLDPTTYHWLKDKTHLPVIDHWWQTETGWAIAGNPVGIENKATKAGSAGCPMPGYQVEILGEEGELLPVNTQGCVAIKLPLPPGCLPGIWGNSARFYSGYLAKYPGYYVTGDGGYIDDDGYLFIMGRTDDVINVAGHRLSTGEMEEVISAHEVVAECAVIGVNDDLKGQVPVGFVIVKNGTTIEKDALEQAVKALIRQQIGAISCIKAVYQVSRLPKTRSGKILRKVMRHIANGEEYQVPSTIDDVDSLRDISACFR